MGTTGITGDSEKGLTDHSGDSDMSVKDLGEVHFQTKVVRMVRQNGYVFINGCKTGIFPTKGKQMYLQEVLINMKMLLWVQKRSHKKCFKI